LSYLPHLGYTNFVLSMNKLMDCSTNVLLENEQIKSFENGKYANEIKECRM